MTTPPKTRKSDKRGARYKSEDRRTLRPMLSHSSIESSAMFRALPALVTCQFGVPDWVRSTSSSRARTISSPLS